MRKYIGQIQSGNAAWVWDQGYSNYIGLGFMNFYMLNINKITTILLQELKV